MSLCIDYQSEDRTYSSSKEAPDGAKRTTAYIMSLCVLGENRILIWQLQPKLFPHQIFQLYSNYTCHLGNIYCETSLSLQLWLHKDCSQDITLMFMKELAPSIIPAINFPCTQTPVIKNNSQGRDLHTSNQHIQHLLPIDPDSVH